MAKTSFTNTDENIESTEQSQAAPSAALTKPVSHEVVPDNFFSNEGVEGAFDKSDVKIPRLALAQAVGPLSGDLGFKPGNFVYNKETDLGNGPIKITLVKMRKYFVEDLEYGSEVFPQIFNTMEEAAVAGFLDVRQKREMGEDHKYVKPVMDVDVLIEGSGDDANFPLSFNDKSFALARWMLQSTAYSRVGKGFFTDSQLALRAGLSTKFYTISAKREKLGQNFVWVPRAQIAGANSPEFVEWARNFRA